MAKIRFENVHLAGITSTVPDTVLTNEDASQSFGEEEMRRVVKNTGVIERRWAKNLCASDMTEDAARRLLDHLAWPKDSIDVLVVVTQCPDYPSPATACLIQDRLGLSHDCAAFDVNLGCSGYVYGLFMLGQFLSSGAMKRGLLLVGDTATKSLSPHDRSVVPLFGDAGCATAMEFVPGAPPMSFVLKTDGSGGPHLYSRAGGSRHKFTRESFDMTMREDGIERSDEHTFMNGAEVLTFALRTVPPLLQNIKAFAGWKDDEVDAYVFHQASTFMLKNVARCSRLAADKVVYGLAKYGNASSASIPLAMSDQLHERLTDHRERLVLAGFGVGWSWAAAAIECGPIFIPKVADMRDERVPRKF